MKYWNVTIEHWSEAHHRYVEYDRQYAAETEREACDEAKDKNPGDIPMYATAIGEFDKDGDLIKY